MPREPQSYGSEQDWVTGRTGQQVNRQKSEPVSHPDFYEGRRDSEGSGEHQGGEVSPVQDQQNAVDSCQIEADGPGAKKVAVKRGTYFKNRDYGS